MTLHEAIEKVLQAAQKPMTVREIANELNLGKWYAKKDKSLIKTSQILARIEEQLSIFKIDRAITPVLIYLNNQAKPIAGSPVLPGKQKSAEKTDNKLNQLKTSLDPISNTDTAILILGAITSDDSLKAGEYYENESNKFWKIIGTIYGTEIPNSYAGKKSLLLKNNIGIWDVSHMALRNDNLGREIKREAPNPLTDFIKSHKNLKVIGFNGRKAEALFDKYFKRKKTLKYVVLPGSSPANASQDLESICEAWRKGLKS